MKIYIVTDLEGVTGVYKFQQTRVAGSPEYDSAVRMMMHDIAAVAEGLREGGAEEILVLDGHGSGCNFTPEGMVGGVRYLTGRPRSQALEGLDSSFAGIVLLGYHAMNGTPDGVLHHTQSSASESRYWYNGIERGEIFQVAVIAGHYNVPIILATGDTAACREARETVDPNLPIVAVKEGKAREAAILLAAEETRPLLAEGGRRAMAEIGRRKPYKPEFPLHLRVRRLASQNGTPENPWYVESERQINSGLEVL